MRWVIIYSRSGEAKKRKRRSRFAEEESYDVRVVTQERGESTRSDRVKSEEIIPDVLKVWRLWLIESEAERKETSGIIFLLFF